MDDGTQPVPVAMPVLPRARTSGLAVAALVLCLIPPTFPIGAILAIVALATIPRRPDRSGAGLAAIGLAVGVVFVGVVLFVVMFVDVVGPIDRRAECAANLHNLGIALTQYANDNDGRLPSWPHAPGNGWGDIGRDGQAPPDATGTHNHSNTRALYIGLVRLRYATADQFVCPSTKDTPAPGGEERWDFASADNVSYSYQNQWSFSTCYTDDPNLAVLADRNPLIRHVPAGEGGAGSRAEPNADIASRQLTRAGVLESANSPNHGGAGQNVLYFDGRVVWRGTPRAGIDAGGGPDNVYTRRGAGEFGDPITPESFVAGPADRHDAWLTP